MANDAPPQATNETEREGPPPTADVSLDVRTVALTVVATVAAILMIQYMQAVLIPIVLGILIAYALEPFVGGLTRLAIPRTIGAGVVLSVLVAVGAYGVYVLTEPATQIVAQLPEAAQHLRDRLRSRQHSASAFQQVQRAATELEQASQDAMSQQTQPPRGVTKVQIVEPAFRASDYLYWGGMGLIGAAGQVAVILFLVYFFLVTGDLYKRKFVKIAGPHLSKKKQTVQILDEINRQIGSFIRVQLATSALVGVATMAALWWLGLQQWIIWGLLAGIFNSIPYLGPVVVTGGLGVVAFLQFDSVSKTANICAVAFLITSLEGFLLTPALMGRAARMNPVAIFVGLLFWSWVWGVWGAVLAVPMLMMLKAVCDHIEELQALGELLGE